VLEMARHRILGHDFGDAEAAETVSFVVHQPQNVTLAEDAHQVAGVIEDWQRTNVVLDKLGGSLADGRIGVDGDDEASFPLQDIPNQHGTSPGYRARERNQRAVIRLRNALDRQFGSVTSGYRDILLPFLQTIFFNN